LEVIALQSGGVPVAISILSVKDAAKAVAGLALVLAICLGASPPSRAADADPCAVPPPSPAASLTALENATTSDIPEITSTTKIVPAGMSADFIVQRDFDAQTVYRAVIKGASTAILYGSRVSARRAPPDHPLVKSGEVVLPATIVTLQVPSSVGGLWPEAAIYIFGCKAGQAGPVFLSTITAPLSDGFYSGALVVIFLVAVYLSIAKAAQVVDKQTDKKLVRYLDPVLLTAGSNGKGNLAKLQILFFSVIVVGLVGYIVSRTGILSDLSSTILILLGIAGVGSAAAKATDVSRNRIDFDNWAWFVRKGWLPHGGLAAVNEAKWRDILTTDGEFDVYHFQNLIFSVVVGGALLVVGLRDLASFSIPETLLGILGLSQVVYLGGKLVGAPSCAELNKATGALKDLERDFVTSAATTPDPAPPTGTKPTDPPPDLDAAIRRAGYPKFTAYSEALKNVRIMFESVTGHKVDDAKLQPAYRF
jgi:hypothetical protein